MLELSIKKIKIRLSFSFFALISVVSLQYSNLNKALLTALISSLIHELGHVLMMCIFKCPPDSITFYAGGIKINSELMFLNTFEEIMILSAGILFNFLFAMICFVTENKGLFLNANIVLGFFNLLPLRYFDGGRMLILLFDKKICKIISFIFISALLVIGIFIFLKGIIPISLLVTFVYIIIEEILNKN